jgi:hypothetical protein
MTEPIYTYDVKIPNWTDINTEPHLDKIFEKCEGIMISSKNFPTFEECASKLELLMIKLSSTEQVVVSKLNPLLHDKKEPEITNESWDSFTVMKSFIADSEMLKTSQLVFQVSGSVKVSQQILGLAK